MPRRESGILTLFQSSDSGRMSASWPLRNAPYSFAERSRVLGGVNAIGVVEPGRALAGSGRVSAAKPAGSGGFVGGHEAMKRDARAETWLRERGVCAYNASADCSARE